MYILTAAVLIMLHLSVCVTMLIWAAGIVGTTIYVVYQYVRTALAKATPRMHAAAELGFMLVLVAAVSVLAMHKYGPMVYLLAHWNACVNFIMHGIQCNTGTTHELLMRIQHAIPQVEHLPEMQQCIVEYMTANPAKLFNIVLQLGTTIQEYGAIFSQNQSLTAYTRILAAQMQMEYTHLMVENCSEWAQYFTPEVERIVRTYVTTSSQECEKVRALRTIIYNSTRLCSEFDTKFALQLDELNMQYKIICEIIKAHKDILCHKCT